MNLLLEHQNREFKQFCPNKDYFLQETDQMFKPLIFLINALAKVRRVINRVVIRQKQKDRHLTKDFFFDIQNLANQLYKSFSIYLKRPHLGKIYFLKNSIPNLVTKKIKHLAIAIILFNESVQENKPLIAINNKAKKTNIRSSVNNLINLDNGTNPVIDELFLKTQDVSSVTSDLVHVFL